MSVQLLYWEGGKKSPLQNWKYLKLIKHLNSYLTPELQIYKVNKNTIKSWYSFSDNTDSIWLIILTMLNSGKEKYITKNRDVERSRKV